MAEDAEQIQQRREDTVGWYVQQAFCQLMTIVALHCHVAWSNMYVFSLSLAGLDAAGKTTALYKLKLGEVITSTPTIGKTFSYNSSCGSNLSKRIEYLFKCIYFLFQCHWNVQCNKSLFLYHMLQALMQRVCNTKDQSLSHGMSVEGTRQ